MRDLNQVIELYTVADHRVVNCAAIYSGVSADVYVVQPDAYGQDGKVLGSAKRKDKTFDAKLTEAIAKNDPIVKQDHRGHVARGRRDGIGWETEIPVTDPGRR